MNRKHVVSSDLESAGYDPGLRVLEVKFRRGGLYRYFDVPQEEYDGLMAAESHGKYLAARIKGRYMYAKV